MIGGCGREAGVRMMIAETPIAAPHLTTDCWTAVGHPCRGIRQSMLDCRVEVGRIGALARANKGTILAACQVSLPDFDTGGKSLAVSEFSYVP